jgi:hypothetical protein
MRQHGGGFTARSRHAAVSDKRAAAHRTPWHRAPWLWMRSARRRSERLTSDGPS